MLPLTLPILLLTFSMLCPTLCPMYTTLIAIDTMPRAIHLATKPLFHPPLFPPLNYSPPLPSCTTLPPQPISRPKHMVMKTTAYTAITTNSSNCNNNCIPIGQLWLLLQVHIIVLSMQPLHNSNKDSSDRNLQSEHSFLNES
jgi:hypothetical protein